jgi:hypothetical protein
MDNMAKLASSKPPGVRKIKIQIDEDIALKILEERKSVADTYSICLRRLFNAIEKRFL